MDVFVCGDGDHIGRRVGRAVLANDVGEVRRVNQAINAGNELWKNFAVNVGGSVVEVGGDEFSIMVDASRLPEVPGVAQRYAETVGATVSVGVGMKLSEAAQALVIAKLRGGNRIVVWDDDMKPEYMKAVEEPKTEAEKIHDEYLAKAGSDSDQHSRSASSTGHDLQLVTKHNTKKNSGPHAGFSVQHRPGFTDQKPGHPGGAPSTGTGEAPAPEMTHAASDFEQQLHDAAQDQSAKDESSNADTADQMEKVKKATAEALVAVRQQLPYIAQLQQASPDAYQAVVGLAQAVTLLGKQVLAPGPSPAEDLEKKEAPIQDPGRLYSLDEVHQATNGFGGDPAASDLVQMHAGTDEPKFHLVDHPVAGIHTMGIIPEKLNPVMAALKAGKTLPPIVLGHEGLALDGNHRVEAHTQLNRPTIRAFQLAPPELEKGDLASSPPANGEMGMSEKPLTKDDHVSLPRPKVPVGAINNGAMKVRHGDGKTSWKQMQSGMVQAQEPGGSPVGANSHPVSSREPSSK